MINYNNAIIIDDEIEIFGIIEPILEEIGFNTIHKIIKSSDLISIYNDEINLVILDLFMPDVDGVEILRYLGEVKSSAYIILISGHSKYVLNSAEKVAQAYGLNILGSITKPFSINTIFDMIQNFNANESTKSIGKKTKQIDFSLAFFKEALQQKYFVLYYQPQLDLKTKEIIGFEALIRIQHPEFGLIFPDQFLQQIEALNLIAEMTEYVITEALSFFGSLKKQGFEKRVSINISTLDLIDNLMPEHIIQLVKQNDLNPQNIVIELIETGLIGNNPKYLEILTRLSMKGLRLSIDDFGTGYASLEQLGNAPFNELKIDKGFVFKLATNPASKAIIESIVALAHKIDIEVVAEGIENKEIAMLLSEIGVDIGQGYYFSIPIRSTSVVDFIEKYSSK